MEKLKLNQYQKCLLDCLKVKFPYIYDGVINVIHEDEGDLGYYGIEDVKNSHSMADAFDRIMADEFRDEEKPVPEDERDLYDFVKSQSVLCERYLEAKKYLIQQVQLIKPKTK